MQAAGDAVMEDVQPLRQFPFLRQGQLDFNNIVLQFIEGTLQQHFPVVHNAHMVAHVLQLPQVVGGHQYRAAVFRHVGQQQVPDLAAHHRVQAVHRLVQHDVVRAAAEGQPEGRLLLHALGHFADGLAQAQVKGAAQLLKARLTEAGVDAAVKQHHVLDGGLGIVKHIVGDVGDAPLHGRVFIHRLPFDQHLAGVLPVDARHMADQGGLACPVGAHQTVDCPLGHRDIQAVQGLKAVKALDQILYLDHWFSPSFRISISCRRGMPSCSISPTSLLKRSSSSCRRARAAWSPSQTKLPLPGTETI